MSCSKADFTVFTLTLFSLSADPAAKSAVPAKVLTSNVFTAAPKSADTAVEDLEPELAIIPAAKLKSTGLL